MADKMNLYKLAFDAHYICVGFDDTMFPGLLRIRPTSIALDFGALVLEIIAN